MDPCTACNGNNPNCKVCGGAGAKYCQKCAGLGRQNCQGCKGTSRVMGPCPDCKKKKVVNCPHCKGTGFEPVEEATPPPAEQPPAEQPPAEQPPAAEGQPPEGGTAEGEGEGEKKPKEPEKPKGPAIVLSGASIEALSGAIEGIKRTPGKKLWKVGVTVTNGDQLGSLVVKCTEFSVRLEKDEVVKALEPEEGHKDARPLMLSEGNGGECTLYFETGYDQTPVKLVFAPPKWHGEPFAIDLPKQK